MFFILVAGIMDELSFLLVLGRDYLFHFRSWIALPLIINS